MDVRYLLILFLLVSCLPQAEVGKGHLSDNNQETTSGSDGGSEEIPESNTGWNYLGAITKNITINVSNLNNSYIVGSNVESFLADTTSFQSDYCIIGRYSIGGNTHELRSRAVPVSYYDFTAKRTVRILRIDFNDLANSQSVCALYPLMILDDNGNHVPETTTVSGSTHNPASLCSTCTSVLPSSKILIFKKTAVDLRELSQAQLDIRSLSLGIDPNNNTSNNPGTCSQSECASRGFDCCLDNQCITDGAIRSSAYSQYPSQLQSAEEERLSNPLAYLNYPHLYYICGTSVPGTTGGSTGGGNYEQGLTQLKKDYYCVQHMKQYKTGETFHQDLLLSTPVFPDESDIPDVATNPATLYPQDIECRSSDTTSPMYYRKVAERLYQNCGCSKTTLEEMIVSCPAYDYTPGPLDASGVPIRIDCYTPPTAEPQIPTNQSVSVNSRSAPHRYFRTCGDEYGNTTPCSTGDQQEGDVFQYLDEGMVLPVQQDFGMNSILGQMTVTLDKALPAKTVNVELDQVYQISTTSGFYTPCPTCSKDSWFSSFTAFPNSSYGVGLQAIGYSTSRDTYSGNTSGGNYEDTIFGRACWVPPTMLPFTHLAYGTTQAQRLNRLKAQAALFANGYQRDWYGFNKGALIGSFDGVSWFAVGKGRIVRSTSKKLYLAINAAFADVATPTLHVVNVQAYDGLTQSAQVDYDPQYHLSHPYQNEAGNCQANHMCETDTDCVTRLGWEYMCADVKDIKTQWPVFDADSNEKPSESQVLTLDQILAQKRFPSSSTKRCIYRGSGSLCKVNPTTITDLNKRKTLTCASNFYCANVNTSSPVFNSKVARYAANLEDIPVTRNHYFGKDANILGRPLSYVASSQTTTLPSDIRLTLSQNLAAYEPTASSTTGICLPGKIVPDSSNQVSMSNPYNQHQYADGFQRTDFINQIGGCNSTLFTNYRYSSCPVIGSDGNFEMFSSSFSTSTYYLKARTQNSCGLDTLLNNTSPSLGSDALSLNSPFRAIESKPLNVQTVVEPSFARDACMRRAGEVCHTDLDCSPNKMHAAQTDIFITDYFGNEAEKKFYSESLVCAQADPKPLITDTEAYKNYKMNLNRCCREIGSDLSTYTSDIPADIRGLTNLAASNNLQAWVAPGIAPSSPRRYSRLASVDGLTDPNNVTSSTTRPPLDGSITRHSTLVSVDTDGIGPLPSFLTYPLARRRTDGTMASPASNGINVLTPKQWATLGEANSDSCCGGGWIRKFSDGGNDWSKRDRLYMDVTNFKCINSRTLLMTNNSDPSLSSLYSTSPAVLVNQDIGRYCMAISDTTKGVCAQYTIEDSMSEVLPSPDPYTSFTINTLKPEHGVNTDYFFSPKSADFDPEIVIDYANEDARRNINIKLPSFVPETVMNALYSAVPNNTAGLVEMFNDDHSMLCTKNDSMPAFPLPTTDDSSNTYCTSTNGCCFDYDSSTRTLKVILDYGMFTASPHADGVHEDFINKKVGIRFTTSINSAGSTLAAGDGRFKPGSSLYYLKRLSQFELSGVPQVTFEPLYCSDVHKNLVPGLFKAIPGLVPVMKERSHFQHPDFSFVSTTDGKVRTSMHGIAHEPIFSANDFKCCTPLGKTTTTPTNCCSGYGVAQGSSGTKYTCALPDGADLMVYFNRFISNEGRGTDQPGGGLVENDFDELSGAPKFETAINQKIAALGNAYCASGKIRQGGAFGNFGLEPSGSETNQADKNYEIVDSSNDIGQNSNAGGTVITGYNAFMNGFRWNHHLYCDDSN